MQVGKQRWLKIAKSLSAFSDEQINEAEYNILHSNIPDIQNKYTLETILKFLIK